MESLLDLYIQNISLTVTNPDNTTIYTNTCTVYTTNSNSDSQNSIVKCKITIHKAFTPALIASKGITMISLVYLREVI